MSALVLGRTASIPQIAPGGHPRLFVSGQGGEGLRDLAQLRATLEAERTRTLWQQLVEAAREDRSAAALLPSSVFPGRNLQAARHENPDWTLCNAVGQRIMRDALVSLVTERRAYLEPVLRQMEALFDERQWPAWMDQAHERFGYPADLRTGMLAHDVALAYDWMHPLLTAEERGAVLEGLTRRGIEPYRESLRQDPWWTHDLNNWLTVIVGGFGIAGMALDGDHAAARELVERAIPMMERYREIYGPEGEFNESVAYANATRLPVEFFLALQYWQRSPDSPLARHPFPATCRWLLYNTLPPGRVAAFGDAAPEAAPEVGYVAAVAAATQDPTLQWFYQRHARSSVSALEFLWHDPQLKPVAPEAQLPRARCYRTHGATVSSRADWNPTLTASVVYGKAGREANHEHNDVGQLCIDAHAERLITDLGSPSAYPADFFEVERWNYYNASVLGHNIIMIGGRELRTPVRERGTAVPTETFGGRFLRFWSDDARGASWTMDTTAAYEGALLVRRHVVHLLPSTAAVLDEVRLAASEEISLRWHTIDRASPDSLGRFLVRGRAAWAAGRIVRLDGPAPAVRRGEHAYRAPFDRDRLGDPLEQRRESYVEALVVAPGCRLLSVFALGGQDGDPASWNDTGAGLEFRGREVTTRVEVSETTLTVHDVTSGAEVSLLL